MKDDKLYLLHVMESIKKIESYIQEGEEVFMQSTMRQDAVMRNFEIIGEATKRISKDLKQTYPDVPWRTVAGFRDVLIHHYNDVEIQEVWRIIEQKLPELKLNIEAILKEL